jgi:hypothetical protein
MQAAVPYARTSVVAKPGPTCLDVAKQRMGPPFAEATQHVVQSTCLDVAKQHFLHFKLGPEWMRDKVGPDATRMRHGCDTDATRMRPLSPEYMRDGAHVVQTGMKGDASGPAGHGRLEPMGQPTPPCFRADCEGGGADML